MIHFCARDGTYPKRPDSDRSGRTPDSLGMALTSASDAVDGSSDRRDDSELGKMGTDRIDHCGLLADE
jgi:hypothetical protein